MSERIRIVAACDRPCGHCPWRVSNQGKRHPHGWYTKRNLRRLWAKARRGDSMTCHPTDPDNCAPEGVPPVPEETETRECAGLLTIVQREIRRWESDPTAYDHRRGLTRDGLTHWALVRGTFGDVPYIGGRAMTAVDLDLTDVHYAPLGDWPVVS